MAGRPETSRAAVAACLGGLGAGSDRPAVVRAHLGAGLLQTEAYARATLRGEALTPAEVEDIVASRIERQGILHRERPPLLVAVMHEQVLYQSAYGDRELMREQVKHLVECAGLPSVQVLIVPRGVGMYPGLGGPFIVAELPGGEHVAHVDSQAKAQIVNDASEVATLNRRWERIRSEAFPRSHSLDLIREAAKIMDMTGARWRKSTYSGNNGGSCVEVADNLAGVILVRDTKDREGGTLAFAPAQWQGFVDLAKRIGPVG